MGLASYRKFIRNFGTITAPITDCFKKGEFQWTDKAKESFRKLKIILQTEPVLLFELECDACVVGVEAVLTQAGHPISYFSENLAEGRRKWTADEQKLYALCSSESLSTLGVPLGSQRIHSTYRPFGLQTDQSTLQLQ